MDGVPPSICPSGFDRPRRPPALFDAPAPRLLREPSRSMSLLVQLRAFVQQLFRERRRAPTTERKEEGMGRSKSENA